MWSYAYFDKKKKTFFMQIDLERNLIQSSKDKIYFGSNISYILSLSNTQSNFQDEKIQSFVVMVSNLFF